MNHTYMISISKPALLMIIPRTLKTFAFSSERIGPVQVSCKSRSFRAKTLLKRYSWYENSTTSNLYSLPTELWHSHYHSPLTMNHITLPTLEISLLETFRCRYRHWIQSDESHKDASFQGWWVYSASLKRHRMNIWSCSRMHDVASGGNNIRTITFDTWFLSSSTMSKPIPLYILSRKLLVIEAFLGFRSEIVILQILILASQSCEVWFLTSNRVLCITDRLS